jgi:hypothetical protein
LLWAGRSAACAVVATAAIAKMDSMILRGMAEPPG